jgi:fructokinase
MAHLVGGIEAGGTKFVCAVGTGPGDLVRARVATEGDPHRTLRQVTDWFRAQRARAGRLDAVGISSFGPVDLNPASATYGYITSTPKPGWAHFDIVGAVAAALDVPVGFDTDVNGAALGEHIWGAAQGLNTFVYVTIGTGIGGGGMSGGRLMHGLVHPEMGHMLVPHNFSLDPYAGHCPYHGDCWEGLASGPAVAERWKAPAHELDADHPAWALEAHYIALALANIVYTLSPQRIILGGSVPKGGKLGPEKFFGLVQYKLRDVLNRYIQSPYVLDHLNTFVVPPVLMDDAGVCGAMALAQQMLDTAA